jgi:Predicted integral membrane protein (DUF2275)/Putative zinc-finger
MEHDDIRHKLSDYIDGSIAPGERRMIEEHLKTCRTCGEALEELQKTIEHIRTVEEIDAPPWMTRKIMSKVREEAEKKRSGFRRLFTPFSVKLPLEALGMAFLVVAAFYVYRSAHREAKYPETPAGQHEAASPEKPRALSQKEKTAAIPQKPGYKALDMKQEYERAALPPAAGKAAPAPPGQTDAFTERAAAPRPPARKEQAAGAPAIAKTKREQAAPAERTFPAIILRTRDGDDAAGNVERLITRLGGSLLKKEVTDAEKSYTVSIDIQKVPELKEKLKLVGKVEDKTGPLPSGAGNVTLKIELVRRPR